MKQRKNLSKLIDGIRPFPDPMLVFNEPVARHRKYLQPLLSIDLQLCNADWQGQVHLLNPIEPYDGYLAERTSAAHTDFCRMNWLGCKLDEQSRYTLLAGFDYFELDSLQANPTAETRDYALELAEQYAEAEKSFSGFVDRYRQFGGLYAGKRFKLAEKDNPKARGYPWLSALGGRAPDGNWADGSGVMSVVDDRKRGLVPVVADIDDFHFIASAAGYHYRQHSADEILLFYSPHARVLLQTFDWT
jgi:hypothetical protein